MTGEEPATGRQVQWLVDLGARPIPPDLTRSEASAWIDELKEYDTTSRRGTVPEGRIRTDLFQRPPTRVEAGPAPPGPTVSVTTGGPAQAASTATSGFQTARELRDQGQAPVAVYEEREEERGPLTPVQVMSKEERESYGIAETETAVIRGTNQAVVPEYGMPAKYLFARLSKNVQSGRMDVRIFASIEGLVFRANAYSDGIRKLSFDYVAPESVPGFDAFVKETKDPQIIARAHVVLGNGTEVVEEGTVRLSEIQLHPSRRNPQRMVARSPVARTNPLELAKKRALARALRWGTGFGGTALDELPPTEQEALPAPKGEKKGAGG